MPRNCLTAMSSHVVVENVAQQKKCLHMAKAKSVPEVPLQSLFLVFSHNPSVGRGKRVGSSVHVQQNVVLPHSQSHFTELLFRPFSCLGDMKVGEPQFSAVPGSFVGVWHGSGRKAEKYKGRLGSKGAECCTQEVMCLHLNGSVGI